MLADPHGATPYRVLPLANWGKIPAWIHASTMDRYHGSAVGLPPQELLTMWGRSSGRGLFPSRSVGASMNWPADSSASREQVVPSQPLAAIHCAPGATPIRLSPPSSPRIVPVTWVPWPVLSHGTSEGLPHTCDGSCQW